MASSESAKPSEYSPTSSFKRMRAQFEHLGRGGAPGDEPLETPALVLGELDDVALLYGGPLRHQVAAAYIESSLTQD